MSWNDYNRIVRREGKLLMRWTTRVVPRDGTQSFDYTAVIDVTDRLLTNRYSCELVPDRLVAGGNRCVMKE